jgi:hypothetical protein
MRYDDSIFRHSCVSSATFEVPGRRVSFFSTSEDWKRELEEYHDRFDFGDQKVCFEKSTTYTFYTHRNLQIWDDIHEYNKDMKIVYMVRDPVDRIRSAYTHSYERGYVDVGIEEAISQRSTLMDVTRYASPSFYSLLWERTGAPSVS